MMTSYWPQTNALMPKCCMFRWRADFRLAANKCARYGILSAVPCTRNNVIINRLCLCDFQIFGLSACLPQINLLVIDFGLAIFVCCPVPLVYLLNMQYSRCCSWGLAVLPRRSHWDIILCCVNNVVLQYIFWTTGRYQYYTRRTTRCFYISAWRGLTPTSINRVDFTCELQGKA